MASYLYIFLVGDLWREGSCLCTNLCISLCVTGKTSPPVHFATPASNRLSGTAGGFGQRNVLPCRLAIERVNPLFSAVCLQSLRSKPPYGV